MVRQAGDGNIMDCPPRDRAGRSDVGLLVGDRMNALLDNCIVCGRQASKPGAGICRYHELQALIDLSYQRMIERLHNPQPARGRRLPVSKRKLRNGYEDPFYEL
jgi:hypothetical protein